jgi:thiol-disulfide isomerase/thioredoxin
MKRVTEIKSRNLRKERNADILRRMRGGEQLASFNSYASWFPPRPMIQKDIHALQELYGNDVVAMNAVHGEARDTHASMDMMPLRLA